MKKKKRKKEKYLKQILFLIVKLNSRKMGKIG